MLYLGSDHAGFVLKEKVKVFLDKKNIHYKDVGAKTFNPDDDYPLYAAKAVKSLTKNDQALLFCGSAQGVAIVANKKKGIRAVAVLSKKDAILSRLHNDANVLCLSGNHLSFWRAKHIFLAFIETPFSEEERHIRRLKEIETLEKKWK